MFIDFKKAFDTVNHKILLDKLSKYGIRGNFKNWITNYLEEREQVMLVNGSVSGSVEVVCGVPQGSILGPLMFLAYINDVERCCQFSKISLYADDTAIYLSGKNHVDTSLLLQQDLSRFEQWCAGNKLTVNVSKTKYMSFSHKPRNCILSLNGERLLRVPTYTYLGVILDPKLNYDKFIQQQTRNVNFRSYQLARLSKYLEMQILVLIYKTFILPIIEYADVLISNANVDSLQKLDRCQSKCLKIAMNVPIRTPTAHVHAVTGLNYIRDRRNMHMLVEAYQRSRCDKYIDHRQLRTRCWDGPVLKMKFSKLTLYQHSLEYTLATLWNKLPPTDRVIPTLELFKTTLKERLIDKIPVLPQ